MTEKTNTTDYTPLKAVDQGNKHDDMIKDDEEGNVYDIRKELASQRITPKMHKYYLSYSYWTVCQAYKCIYILITITFITILLYYNRYFYSLYQQFKPYDCTSVDDPESFNISSSDIDLVFYLIIGYFVVLLLMIIIYIYSYFTIKKQVFEKGKLIWNNNDNNNTANIQRNKTAKDRYYINSISHKKCVKWTKINMLFIWIISYFYGIFCSAISQSMVWYDIDTWRNQCCYESTDRMDFKSSCPIHQNQNEPFISAKLSIIIGIFIVIALFQLCLTPCFVNTGNTKRMRCTLVCLNCLKTCAGG